MKYTNKIRKPRHYRMVYSRVLRLLSKLNNCNREYAIQIIEENKDRYATKYN